MAPGRSLASHASRPERAAGYFVTARGAEQLVAIADCLEHKRCCGR